MSDHLERAAERLDAWEPSAPNPSRAFRAFRAVWPVLKPEALHGLAGDFVKALDPHTEADPVAVLGQVLTYFGNVIGRGPHFVAEADHHALNLFATFVGETSKARKGSSEGHVRALFNQVDGDWIEQRIQHGLSSGEGLIWSVRDPIEKGDEVVDYGVSDKRVLVVESEFASTLRVIGRDGNTLSPVVRNAWDRGDLRTMTKNSPAVATGAHVSVIGHITADELRRYLTSTEAGNGFGNRFLWFAVRRSKCLPEGGHFTDADREPFAERFRAAVEFARGAGELRRGDDAREVWAAIYPELSEGKPGLFGSVTARAEAQVMRLACLYALLERRSVVETDHLMAALALWDHAEGSARFVFGDAIGDPAADRIVRALGEAPDGLTRSQIRRLFAGHKSKAALDRALGSLLEQGLAGPEKVETDGRPVEVWRSSHGAR